MDRRPERRQTLVKPPDRRLVGKVDAGRDMDAGVVAMRKPFQLGGDDIGDVANRPGGAQRADHGGSQGAGAAGDDDMRAVISDHGLPSVAESQVEAKRAGDSTPAPRIRDRIS